MADGSLSIEALKPSDVAAALALSTAAGWNQLAGDWHRLMRLWPALCVGGSINGNLIATTTIAQFGDCGWVGMVLVDSRYQERGFGGMIFDAAIRAADTAGIRTLGLDATEQGRHLYLRRGFTDVHPITRWRRQASPSPVDSILAPVPAAKDWTEIVRLDQLATGLNREALLRHLASEQGVRWDVVRGETGLHGYSILRPGRTARHLGPVIADDLSTAASLISTASRACAEPFLIDALAGTPLEASLTQLGFIPARKLVRMHRHALETSPSARRRPSPFAAIGFELG